MSWNRKSNRMEFAHVFFVDTVKCNYVFLFTVVIPVVKITFTSLCVWL